MMPKTTFSPGLPYLQRCPFRGSLVLSSMALYMLMFHKPIFSTPDFSHYLSIPTRKHPPYLFTYLSEAYLKLKLNSQILANHVFCLVFPISENTSENCWEGKNTEILHSFLTSHSQFISISVSSSFSKFIWIFISPVTTTCSKLSRVSCLQFKHILTFTCFYSSIINSPDSSWNDHLNM